MARPKGSKNVASFFNAEVLATRLKCDPLEILMRFAMGDWEGLGYECDTYLVEKAEGGAEEKPNEKPITMKYIISAEMRLTAAKECAKYLYSAKQAVALSTPDGAIKVVIEDYQTKEK